MRKIVLAGVLAAFAAVSVAQAIEFSAAIEGASIPSPPFASTDVFPLVRSGVTYRLPVTTIRWPLTATQNLYVATTGSDTSNRCDASGTPCLTLQRAVDQYLLNYDGRGFVTNINVGNGTYAGFVCSGSPVGTASGTNTPAYMSIVGTNGSANVIISETGSLGASAGAVGANNNCFVSLQGVKVQSTNNNGVFAASNGTVQINTDVILGTAGASAAKMHADYGAGIIKVSSSYTSVGNAGAEVQGTLAGHIIYNESALTVTLSGTPAYAIAFANVYDTSVVYINSNYVTFSGSATGKRFEAHSGGVIETIAGAAGSYLPGNSAGTTDGGAHYVPGTFNIGTSPIIASNVTVAGSANPTGTTNLTGAGVMMGGGGTITPATSGNILVTFSGACSNNTVNDGGMVTIYVGTGTAPSNGDALTGSPIGSSILFEEAAAGKFIPCSGSALATSQGIGTALWYQLALVARTGGTANLWQVSMTAAEM